MFSELTVVKSVTVNLLTFFRVSHTRYHNREGDMSTELDNLLKNKSVVHPIVTCKL